MPLERCHDWPWTSSHQKIQRNRETGCIHCGQLKLDDAVPRLRSLLEDKSTFSRIGYREEVVYYVRKAAKEALEAMGHKAEAVVEYYPATRDVYHSGRKEFLTIPNTEEAGRTLEKEEREAKPDTPEQIYADTARHCRAMWNAVAPPPDATRKSIEALYGPPVAPVVMGKDGRMTARYNLGLEIDYVGERAQRIRFSLGGDLSRVELAGKDQNTQFTQKQYEDIMRRLR